MSVNEDIRIAKQRLDGIIDSSATGTGTATLSNGEQSVFTIITTADSGGKVFVVADVTLYIGSVDADNQLPGGSTTDESAWQVIGPWADWGATDNTNHITRIYVRNISACASQSVLLRTISRAIINSPTLGVT